MDCFKKCMDPCEKAVRDARISRNDVDEEVALASPRSSPSSPTFNGKEPCKSVD
jgi:L1 cell adhesion molecule like protein